MFPVFVCRVLPLFFLGMPGLSSCVVRSYGPPPPPRGYYRHGYGRPLPPPPGPYRGRY